MNSIQISIARKQMHKTSAGYTDAVYCFFFRTDWLEPEEGAVVLDKLQEAFPFPEYQVSLATRTIKLVTEDLN